MPGSYGNFNLYLASQAAYISYSNASEAVTLPVGTVAVSLYATTRCWIKIGYPGETATAAAPGAEKTWVQRIFPLNADSPIDVAVPASVEASKVQVAVIRDTADGTLDIIARFE